MKARPILFSAPMIRALLAGTKTQTRRAIKAPTASGRFVFSFNHGIPELNFGPDDCKANGDLRWHRCPYGQPGDLLWVKESHRLLACECTETCRVPGPVHYSADESGYQGASMQRLRPSIHMPRWASRLTLRITDVRVQRLQEISAEDAKAEGLDFVPDGLARWGVYGLVGSWSGDPRISYRALWQSINGLGSWDANPWVWALTFKVIKANVDQVAA